jgi:hypothetical protein
MRRRQIFSHLNARDNRAPVPSGAGMGAATASQPDLPSPVSREEEDAKAVIWEAPGVQTYTYAGPEWKFEKFDNNMIAENAEVPFKTPGTDPEAASLVKKKRGWPKGKKRKP